MITVDKYLTIRELDETNENYEFDLVSLVFDIPISELDELSSNDFLSYRDKIKQILSIRHFTGDIIVSDTKLTFNLNQLTFGQFIDLEESLKNEDYNLFLQTILNTNLYLLDLSITILFYLIDEYLKHRTNLIESYDDLFDQDDDIEEESIEQPLITPLKRMADDQKNKKSKKQKQWGWFSIAFSLAKNDITKIDDVLNQNFVKVLNILSMIKDLEIELNPSSYPMM